MNRAVDFPTCSRLFKTFLSRLAQLFPACPRTDAKSKLLLARVLMAVGTLLCRGCLHGYGFGKEPDTGMTEIAPCPIGPKSKVRVKTPGGGAAKVKTAVTSTSCAKLT